MAESNPTSRPSKRSSSSKRSHSKKSTEAAQAGKTAAKTAATNGEHRPHVATRSPVEQLTAMCASKANSTRGAVQQEWFGLGSYLSRFALEQQQQQAPAAQQQQQPQSTLAMAAGARG